MTDDATTVARIPWSSRTVRIVLLSTLLAPLGVPLLSPTLPVLRETFEVSDAQASLLISIYFLTGIFLSPVLGLLADRIGRRRVLIPSLFVFALTGGVIVFAPSYLWVLGLRLIQGTAAAGILIMTVTLIGDSVGEAQRNTVLGVNTAVLLAGAAVFPVIGGAVVAYGRQVPFLMYLLALPLGVYALRVLEEPHHDRGRRGLGYLYGAARALPLAPAMLLYGAAALAELLFFGAILTSLPFHLAGTYGLEPVAIGLLLMGMTIVSAAVASQNGRLARRFSNERMIGFAFACFGVGLVGAWFAPSAVFVGLAVLVYGAGVGLPLPSIDASVSRLVPASYRGGALSLRNSMTFLGRALGPVVFATVAATTGYHAVLLYAGLGSLVLAGTVVVLSGVGRESAEPEPSGT